MPPCCWIENSIDYEGLYYYRPNTDTLTVLLLLVKLAISIDL